MTMERSEAQNTKPFEETLQVLGASGGERILHDTDGSIRTLFGISLKEKGSSITHDIAIDIEKKTLQITVLGEPNEPDSKLFPKIATSTYENYEGFEVVKGRNAVRFFGTDWSLTLERYWDTPGKLRFDSEGKSPQTEVVPENVKIDLTQPVCKVAL